MLISFSPVVAPAVRPAHAEPPPAAEPEAEIVDRGPENLPKPGIRPEGQAHTALDAACSAVPGPLRVAFFDVEDWHRPIIENTLADRNVDVVHLDSEHLTEANVDKAREADVVSIFFSPTDESLMDEMPDLKLICTRSTGFDHIDLEAAKARDIKVANVPAYGDETVAEYAMGLILALSRKLAPTLENSKAGIFTQLGQRGMDLNGKTLGVVGTGKIGRKLIKMAQAFDMKVVCYDAYPRQDVVDELGARYAPIDEVLQQADVVSLHIPHTPGTHHFLNADRLAMMKEGALLVNTARGGVVDTVALRESLVKGHLGGAALDTFEGEEILMKPETAAFASEDERRLAEVSASLADLPNVILTPHNAYNSQEAVRRIIDTDLADILSFEQTGDCEHRVV